MTKFLNTENAIDFQFSSSIEINLQFSMFNFGIIKLKKKFIDSVNIELAVKKPPQLIYMMRVPHGQQYIEDLAFYDI